MSKALSEQYGCDPRTARRWNEFGHKVREAPPWSEGPVALAEWANRHGHKIPAWLQASLLMSKPEGKEQSHVAVDGEPLETDNVEVLQGLIDSFNQQIDAAKRSGAAPVTLAALGKDYAKLCTALDKMKAERRACDDNLIDKSRVVEAVERLHVSIPGRVHDELVAMRDDLHNASHPDSSTFREWVKEFCDNVFGSLAGGFAEQLKPVV